MAGFDPRATAAIGFALRDKKVRFERIGAEAKGFGLDIEEVDDARPWGGYVRFTPDSLDAFLKAYWRTFLTDYWRDLLDDYLRRLPSETAIGAKLLLVAPGQRLSLQAHQERAELWRVLEGPVVVVTGTNEEQVSDREMRPGEIVRIPRKHLHRLAAPPSGWGVVAEIWLHENPRKPSIEEDIQRYDDDYWLVANENAPER
ncbi:hypothetical protein ACFL09_03960 [Planctomycetota bacterium]